MDVFKMTKNLSPPKIFETYLDTKTNDTSDFIVNLFENIEKEIAKLHEEQAIITEKMMHTTIYDEIQYLSNRSTEIISLIEEKEMRWLELSEMTI